jgi:HEPN domain-containing protein
MDRSKDWFEQAERDLAFGKTAASTGHHEWAAFIAQQGAEKAVKALVQSLRGAVRGHSITEILRSLMPSVSVSQEVIQSAQALDKVYVTSRYPNGFASGRPADYFSGTDSQEFLDHARRILEFCRSQIYRPGPSAP